MSLLDRLFSEAKGRNFVSKEISHLEKDKGYEHKRAIAAALNVARKKGYQVSESIASAAKKAREVHDHAHLVINNLPKIDLTSPEGVRKAAKSTVWVYNKKFPASKNTMGESLYDRVGLRESFEKGARVNDVKDRASSDINTHFPKRPGASSSNNPYSGARRNLRWMRDKLGFQRPLKKMKTMGKLGNYDPDYEDSEDMKIYHSRQTGGGRHIVRKTIK